MNYTALIGNPTGHSVSHVMYGELAKAAGMTEFYQHIRLNIEPSSLDESLKAFNTLHFAGLNVTLPYKLEVMKYLDELDPVINDLGAVNTIKLGTTKKGYNTDWAGIAESVSRFGGLEQYKTATVLGTGGAARAAIYACKQLGAKRINVVYRTEASEGTRKLQEQGEELGIRLYAYSDIASLVDASQLVVHATSAGMVGKDAQAFDFHLLKNVILKDKVFIDAVFNPLQTPVLEYFRSGGSTVIDGLWMMIFQGIKSLSIWLDQEIVVDNRELTRIHNLMEKELSGNV